MRRLLAALLFSTIIPLNLQASDGRFTAGSPSTVRNDDSCDLSNLPAATLLLPYFEVDFNSPQTTAMTTLFAVTNVSRYPQIVRVTLWTDYGFPIYTFDIFLTGYDVQGINLYDVIARGIIAPTSGTSFTTRPGELSAPNSGNPNFLPNVAVNCSGLPGAIPSNAVRDMRDALTTGVASSCKAVGGVHTNAVGYATMDVVATCGPHSPQDPAYYTDELLYDNVLMGDYQQTNPNPATGNYAGGNPLVAIRAIPEGGAAGSRPGTNLPYTFYDRLLSASGDRTRDRRQPLPSAFAARFIQGGTGEFSTKYKIWREAITGAAPSCVDYRKNAQMPVMEIVRFDEHENPTVTTPPPSGAATPSFPAHVSLPATSSMSTSSSVFPPLSTSGDAGGWMYINANNGGSLLYGAAFGRDFVTGTSTTNGPRQSQNWIVVSMFAEGRFSVDFDGLPLGNGCSPAAPTSTANSATGMPLGPLPDVNP